MNKRPTIAHVCSSLPHGGLSRVVLDLAHEQCSSLNVAIIATKTGGYYWAHAESEFPDSFRITTNSKLVRYLRLFRVLKRLEPTIVHVHQEAYAPSIAKLARSPVIVETIHHSEYWKTLGNPAIRLANKFAIDASVLVSESEFRRAGGGYFMGKIKTYIRNGTRCEPYNSHKLSSSCKKIGAIGRLVRWKGFDTLLNAFSNVSSTNSDLTLHLAGEGDDYSRLLKLADQLNIRDKVIFLGHVKEPSKFIQEMDLIVFPSLAEEPFGLVAIEVMAAGVPIVASRIPSILEICREGSDAVLFEPGDSDDLSMSIRQVSLPG